MTTRRAAILALILLIAVVILSAGTAMTTAAQPEAGPWMISAGVTGGYLLNTRTGEVWRLSNEVKIKVKETE
jgi:hypothetical protein